MINDFNNISGLLSSFTFQAGIQKDTGEKKSFSLVSYEKLYRD